MRQQALIPSGCQQRSSNVATHNGKFAFSSTMAIYVYSLQSKEPRLQKILAQSGKCFSAICWNPNEADQLACATTDSVIRKYSIEKEVPTSWTQVPTRCTVGQLEWFRPVPLARWACITARRMGHRVAQVQGRHHMLQADGRRSRNNSRRNKVECRPGPQQSRREDGNQKPALS
ncbi:unnamed protein product [Ostreobium quekettii]|uniref:Uncharacterized protein n=1 Tax=Ostreobium quekettii TaxID=121088 RepID=A0A8S1IR64_9CHLO|nr:unnamed protein product [Ostreobium quekettii]